jgi:hypothetical protein
MQETRKLRRQLAISRLEQAVSMGTRGRLDLATRLAGEAIQLDPEVPESHAILAKVRFWSGDIDGAEQSLSTAERAGLPRDLAQSMHDAIQQMRRREQQDREIAKLQAEAKRARAAAVAGALAAADAWLTVERLPALLFLACMFLMLGIASRL